jgi:aryl-alcohol dehydrogenase-like predicted oxidoreductase
MKQRQLGQTGLVVSRLALGTWTWGQETAIDDAAGQLKAFLDAGGSLVDTADVYAFGESERVLGRLLRHHSREEVIVSTKAGGLLEESPSGSYANASRRHLLAALDESLRRLGLDHVDLWQLHLWDNDTPLEESLATLDVAVTSGRARYVGISNYNAAQTATAAAWQLARPGRAPLASTQIEYSLLARTVETEVLPAAASAGLGVLAWSPLGRGVLTGKYLGQTPADSRALSAERSGFVQPYLDQRCAHITEAVVTAAGTLGVTPAAVALAWVRDRPGVTAPVVGARTLGQLAGSLDAEELTLPTEIRTTLDDVSAR